MNTIHINDVIRPKTKAEFHQNLKRYFVTNNNYKDLVLYDSKNSILRVMPKFDKDSFTFYTNLESQKSLELKENPNAEMCFHWKSLLRQVRVKGLISKVQDSKADKYYNSRPYDSKIGAWASKQSSILKSREQLIKSIEDYKIKYKDDKSIPRPNYWSGWFLIPKKIEFWLQVDGRIHERLVYEKNENDVWNKYLLSP